MTAAPWSLTLDISGSNLHLFVRVTDKAGNKRHHDLHYKVDNSGPRVAPVSVRVDAIGPSITSITPAAGALLRGSYLHSAVKATDPSGIGWITVNGFSDDQPNAVVAPALRWGLSFCVVDHS